MPAARKYPNELRKRSVRLVREARGQEPGLSVTAAVRRIGLRVGVNPDTLRGWCKQAAIDAGEAPGTSTADGKRIRELEREVKELKRANKILLAASSFLRAGAVRHKAPGVSREGERPCPPGRRSGWVKPGGSRTPEERRGWWQAAPTEAGRAGTARQRGSVRRGQKV
jgi:transposase-like protein